MGFSGPAGDLPTEAQGPMTEPESSALQKIFLGPDGLRAGWRLAIFVFMYLVFSGVTFTVMFHFQGRRGPAKVTELTPTLLLISEGIGFGAVLLGSFVMSRIERRKMGVYGLPLRKALGRNFWVGCLWGFGALTALLLVFHAAGDYEYGTPMLHGGAAVTRGIVWAITFLMVGLSEEYTFRGYTQYTLTTGMGFWPSALALSLLFGLAHKSNSGEQWLGLAQVVIIALFFAFTLWKTGNLWFAVGYHAAWDWGQTFFYGTADSGLLGRGHLLSPSAHGPAWFTGGTVGPEGSVLNVPLVLLVALLFHFAYRQRAEYPQSGRK